MSVTHIKRLLAAITLALFFSACKWTSYSFQAIRPGDITLPSYLTTIAIIDRSMPRDGYLEGIEAFSSGEQLDQDRICRQQAIEGAVIALSNSPRVRIVHTNIEESGNASGAGLPFPLRWDAINEVCKQYGAEAVLSLEALDTDNVIQSSTEKRTGKRKDGSTYTYYQTNVSLKTYIKLGWRLYDPRTQKIFDEQVLEDTRNNSGTGATKEAALNAMSSPVELTRKMAIKLGYRYGARLAPTYVTVDRSYYARAKGYKNDMKLASAYAKGKNWEKAINIWQEILNTAKGDYKVCGRAAYNIAVAYEALGNLNKAEDWARVAQMRYGNNAALGYLATLRDVRKANDKLKEQFNNRFSGNK